jgi:hypothetical protein
MVWVYQHSIHRQHPIADSKSYTDTDSNTDTYADIDSYADTGSSIFCRSNDWFRVNSTNGSVEFRSKQFSYI